MPPKKKLKIPEGQQNMFSFLSAPRTDTVSDSANENADSESGEEQPASSSAQSLGQSAETSAPSSSQSNRRHSDKWLKLYPWLRYSDTPDGSTVMKCQYCLDAGRNNSYTKGCKNFKTSSLREHVTTQDHQLAIAAPKLKVDAEKTKDKIRTNEEKGLLVALKAAFWLAKEGIPMLKFKSLMSFLENDLNITEASYLRTSSHIAYDSQYSADGFVDSLSQTVEEYITDKLQQSPCVTVLSDESTDITVHKRLVIYAQAVDPITLVPSTYFITNIHITDATGKGITNAILQEMSGRGIDATKIMGLGSDGASVMTGQKNGVSGRMKRENPHQVNTHCVAHRLCLCTSQAADECPQVKNYQETLTSVYYYFHGSASRGDRLEAIQNALDDPKVRFKEVHSVRWMSFYLALEAVFKSLDSLLVYLAEATLKDPKAMGLKKKIATVSFISMTYLLMDIIPIVTKLNMFLQKPNIDVALVNVKLDRCISDLTALKETDGQYMQMLAKDIVNSHFRGHQLTPSSHDLQATKVMFLDKLIDNIDSRFPNTDFITAFGVLGMRPISTCSKEELQTWGDAEMHRLLEHYGEEQKHTWEDEDGKKHTKISPAILSPQETLAEWRELKATVLAVGYHRDDLPTLWHNIAINHRDDFPNMMKLAALCLTLPIHTADCERGFSVQNQILTPSRNRLLPQNQDKLLRIRIEGGESSSFNFDKALDLWRHTKTRKIFAKRKQ